MDVIAKTVKKRNQFAEDESETGGPIVTEDNTIKREKLKSKEKAPKEKLPQYKKGGMVKKTGLAKVHKGEMVIPARKTESIERFMRRRNRKEGKS